MSMIEQAKAIRDAMDYAGASLDEDTALICVALYRPWKVGVNYKVNDYFTYGVNSVGAPSSIVWHRLTPLRTIGDLTLFLPCTHPSVSTRRATPSGLSPSAHMTHTTPGTLSSTRTSSTGR